MAKFRFRYETVAQVRKKEADKAMAELAKAQRKLNTVKVLRQQLIENLNRSLEDRERLAEESLAPSYYLIVEDFILGTKSRIVQADAAVEHAEGLVEKARGFYLDKKKKVEVLEKVRERDFEKFKQGLRKLENKKTDELYVTRHQKRTIA